MKSSTPTHTKIASNDATMFFAKRMMLESIKPIPVNEKIANVSYLKYGYASVAQLAHCRWRALHLTLA
ncbi:conserved hypothetical protein [Alteromonas infernus]